MILNQETTLFLMIDIQEKLLNAVINKEQLEKKAKILAKTAEILNLPFFITEQYPQGLGKTIKGLDNGTKTFVKTSFNALLEDDIVVELNKIGKKQIVLFGIETHICVYQTAIALQQKGFDVTLIKDASGSRSEIEHKSAIEILAQNGIKIKTTEMILFELLKSSKHSMFKEIQALIK